MVYNELNSESVLYKNGFTTSYFSIYDDDKQFPYIEIDNATDKDTKKVALYYLDQYRKYILEKQSQIQKRSKKSKDYDYAYTRREFFQSDLEINHVQNTYHEESDFRHLQTREVKITNTQIVQFLQWYKNIPVYGSLATVEIDKKNKLIGISVNFGDPTEIDILSHISISEAESLIREKGYKSQYWEVTPRLNYYFDSLKEDWRLVYIVETKLKQKPLNKTLSSIPKLVDYIVDAHNKKVISELPNVRTLTAS